MLFKVSFFHMKIAASVTKKLASRLWPVLFILAYIFLIYACSYFAVK